MGSRDRKRRDASPCIAAGIDFGAVCHSKRLLSLAASRNQEGIVRLFLSIDGVDPEPKDSFGYTPLSRAALVNAVGVTKTLIDHGACVSTEDIHRRQPLLHAAGQNSVNSIAAADGGRRTALHYAAIRGEKHVVGLLVSRGANTNARDIYGITPAALPARNDHEVVMVRMLRRSVVDLDSKDDFGHSLAWGAFSSGSPELQQLLVDYAARVGRWCPLEEELHSTRVDRVAPFNADIPWCDVCGRSTVGGTLCGTCKINGKRFLICSDCMVIGAKCRDSARSLAPRSIEAERSTIHTPVAIMLL